MVTEHTEHAHEHEHTDEMTSAPTPSPRPKSVFLKGITAGVGIVVLLAVVAGVGVTYRFPGSLPFMDSALAAVHAPAAVVNGSVITWHDIALDSQALTHYIQNQGAQAPTLSADEIRLRVLHRLLLSSVAESVARERAVVISDDEVNKQTDVFATQLGGKDKMTAEVLRQYGWTFEQYRDRVIRSMVLMDALQKSFDTDPSVSGAAEQKARDALAQIKAGKDFATLAQAESEDGSAPQGGDLGFIKRGETVQPFEDAAFALQAGQVSDVVKTSFGYHIIKVEEVKKDVKGVVTEVHARHILFKTPAVAGLLQARLDAASVWQFMHTSEAARNSLDNKPIGQ